MVDVLVVGAGVAGLTSAVRLAEAGLTVRVIAADPPERTTSAVAGACWGPDLVTDPRGPAWSETGRRVFNELAEDPDTGVHLAAGLQAVPAPLVNPTPIAIPDVASSVAKPPDWVTALPDFHRCDLGELPSGYLTGWRYTAPLIDMPRFLAYLVRRLAAAGVTVEAHRIGGLAELAGAAGTVVNCTGLAARELVPDGGFAPTRGQLVVVENPGITEFFIEFDEDPVMTYFFPHGDHVILGGTAIADWEDLTPDPATAAGIVKRCAAIEPRFRDATVRGHRVGLRPMRTSVRVERDQASVVHNYGHGGAGVTLSWGCADDVVALVTA